MNSKSDCFPALLEAARYGVVLDEHKLEKLTYGSLVRLYQFAAFEDETTTAIPSVPRNGETINGKAIEVVLTDDIRNVMSSVGTPVLEKRKHGLVVNEMTSGLKNGQPVSFTLGNVFEIVSSKPN